MNTNMQNEEQNDNQLKILIVDDAAFMRKMIAGILEMDRGLSVLDTAKNGLDALNKIKAVNPDVITLDIDMPVMDGLSAIRHIMIENPVPIVALSSLVDNGSVTFEALRLGVVDFVPKPSGAISTDLDKAKQLIIDRIKIAKNVNIENIRRVRLPKKWGTRKKMDNLYGYIPLEYLVAVGTSLSGPNTVIRFLSKLPPTLPSAIVVVQEISPRIIKSFVEEFDEHVPWNVAIAEDGQVLEQGTCYICSNERSVGVRLNTSGDPCVIIEDSKENPLDYLFSTAAQTFHQNCIGILLTGLGNDGAEGFRKINQESGVTMVQDARCCVYPNLTDYAIKQGVVDMVLDENQLSDTVESLVNPNVG